MAMKLRMLLLASVGLGLATGCGDPKEKMREAQKRRDAEKKKFEEEKEARQKAANPKFQRAQLEPFWGDEAYARITTGKPCPDGLWALFEEVPGEGAEKDKFLADQSATAEKVKRLTYYAILPLGGGVTPGKFNAKKKAIPVEVEGLVECFDKAGLISVAWGKPAKSFKPRNPDEEGLTPQAVWRAKPVVLNVPMKSAADAKKFLETDAVTMEARVVFTLGATQVDKRLLKTPRYLEDGTEITNMVDWGAGRLINVNLVGVRLATNHEHNFLVEQRTGTPTASAAR